MSKRGDLQVRGGDAHPDQQYFHKAAMVLISHDDDMTVGLILNRPSAIHIDGWRFFYGGPVAEAGLFHRNDGDAVHPEPRMTICLHCWTKLLRDNTFPCTNSQL